MKYRSLTALLVLVTGGSLFSCKERRGQSSGLLDDPSTFGADWGEISIGSEDDDSYESHPFDASSPGGYFKIPIRIDGFTTLYMSVSANSRNSTFTDVNGDGQIDYPLMRLYVQRGGQGNLEPAVGNNRDIPFQSQDQYWASADLDLGETKKDDVYYAVFLQSPNRQFDNNFTAEISGAHEGLTRLTQPVTEIPLAADGEDYNFTSNVTATLPSVQLKFDLENNGQAALPMRLNVNAYSYNPQGCDKKASLVFLYDDNNGQGQKTAEIAKDVGGCDLDREIGFVRKPGGKYSVILELTNINGQPIDKVDVSVWGSEYRSGRQTGDMSAREFNVRDDGSINRNQRAGIIDLANDWVPSQSQRGKPTQDIAFEGKFENGNPRMFLDVNVYGNFFNPINIDTTTKRPAKLIIRETDGQNSTDKVIPLGGPDRIEGNATIRLNPNARYRFIFELSYGPDIQGNISLSLQKSESILPPETSNVIAAKGRLKDVPGAEWQTRFFFPDATTYGQFYQAEGQAGRFHFVEHMPPNHLIPAVDPNNPTDASGREYPNEQLSRSASTGVPMMEKAVYYAMVTTRRYWHKMQDEDEIGNVPAGGSHYVDKGTISACLGNEANHWSDLILHYYCQFGQLRSCYTGYIRDAAGDLSAEPDPRVRVVKANLLRVDSFNHCMNVAENIDLQTAANQGKMSEYEWNWLKTTRVKDEDGNDIDFGSGPINMAAVFQYVMNSPTFRYHFDAEQDVINTFYRVDSPADLNSCKTTRLARSIDESDQNYCVNDKKHDPLLEAKAR